MKVSIIIPAYNVENCIKRCLDSIINQIYKNLEIIIIDDASTDKTKKIINEYAQKDDRIIPFYQSTNKGVSAARNIGLKASTGEYIMFVDSDDSLTKEAIRRLIDVANKYDSDYVDSYHLFEYKKTNGKLIKFTEKKVPKKILVMGNVKNNPKITTMTSYITGKLIKKDLIGNLLFDETLKCYEDLVFEQNLKSRVNNYVFLNRVIYIYYQRPNSLVNSLGKNHLCFMDAAKKVKEIYENYSNEIQIEIEAMLINNMFATFVTKIIKNNDTIKNNVKLSKEYFLILTKIYPNYNNNKKVNFIIKKCIDVFLKDEKKLYKFIKIMRKINFINLYFLFLSITNKYEIKNPLK